MIYGPDCPPECLRQCERCGAPDELTTVAGLDVCEDCHDECAYCGAPTLRADLYRTLDDDLVCAHCYVIEAVESEMAMQEGEA